MDLRTETSAAVLIVKTFPPECSLNNIFQPGTTREKGTSDGYRLKNEKDMHRQHFEEGRR